VEASLEAFSPFVPLNDLDSGLPVAVFLWTLRNPGKRRVEASIAATMPNPVGLEGTESLVGSRYAGFGTNRNELVHDGHLWGLSMTSPRYAPTDLRHGSLALGTAWPKVSAVTRWPSPGGWELWELQAFWDEFAANGRERGPADAAPSAEGRTDTGSLCALLDLEPGESLTVPFILAWHFPNRVNDWNTEPEVRGKIIRNHYATWLPDAWSVLRYTSREYERLERESRAFERSFWNSTLPPERSWSMKVTPPAVPTPGIAGGGKAKERASGSAPSSRLRCALIAAYCSSGALRSPQSSKITKKKAL
jgi:uncharacterized protein (DUF608 family)